ncbi:MAG TPA: glycosyl hydrolase [Phycisphaerae bacterium]|nr:glycosyl hydrolase [Phycisphaerae bacterium]HRY71051.1 glycosyl hydrolase [Phycisphaerae bacterium]HSA29141.1 glycosyl hydrolase [Phycisphaerae bacterium]
MNHLKFSPYLLIHLLWLVSVAASAEELVQTFREPPDAARPGAYWYFMDGNLSREGMTRDLESMRAAGIGHVVFLEVNVGVPRGPVDFLSEEWQDLYVHAVREAERLGIEIILGSGPGWTGSGGPWVKPEQSMQHLVASPVEVQGPGSFTGTLPVAPPRRPFFGDVPKQMRVQWESYYRDVAVLAFPTPLTPATIPDIDEKALVYRAPFSSRPHVKARLEAPAEFPADPPRSTIPLDRVIDLTQRLKPDGTLDWQIPEGKWTVLRFVSRNNGASTRPAPNPGIGFECDKFDAAALDAHFAEYGGKLLEKVGPRQSGRGWTMLHIDSWEMGAQNWTPNWREEFRKRRGYDPQPFYPAYLGYVVGSREQTERFLWDLRLTGQELVIQNHAERLRQIGHKHGFTLSIEPYDMNPTCDFDLGAVADVPMGEFWSLGPDTTYSCHTASSIAHVLGRPVVAAEAFTGAPGENWRFYPGSLKNQGDWAFATGINRLTYHTFAHKPDEGRPGMVMGPYGVHWDRGQTWWPMVDSYHRYVSRCQQLLRQGRTVADVLYLIPEGAPAVFQPPSSAFAGSRRLPDRKGYNFDGCSAEVLTRFAKTKSGSIVFPSGAEYRVLVLPSVDTMTPQLLDKIEGLVCAGATIVGNPPRKSPSLVDYPDCDRRVADKAKSLWVGLTPPPDRSSKPHGKGRVIWGQALSEASPEISPILDAKWIWRDEGDPARVAAVQKVLFRREYVVPTSRRLSGVQIEMTADNSFVVSLNGTPVLEGGNFNQIYCADASGAALRRGTNVFTVLAENGGDAPNPAGLIGAIILTFTDRSQHLIHTDDSWTAAPAEKPEESAPSRILGAAKVLPWKLSPQPAAAPLYPQYDLTAAVLSEMGVAEDFVSDSPLRYTHRRMKDRDIYFLANRSDEAVEAVASFRVSAGVPELWNPINGEIRALPKFTRTSSKTEIPLRFEPYESCFIVFPASSNAAVASPTQAARNCQLPTVLQTLETSWAVSFDPTMGAPANVRFETLEDWTQRPELGLKHYSGVATYRSSFNVDAAAISSAGSRLLLDLGKVEVMARVRVNGMDCGVAWTDPLRVDISRAVKPTGNVLEIEVANLWPNRMIGDAAAPEQMLTQTTYRPFKADDPLLPSGLLGPIRLLKEDTLPNK